MKIQWRGLHQSTSGYGEVTRYYARVLSDMGHDVKLSQHEHIGDRRVEHLDRNQRDLIAGLSGDHFLPDVVVDSSFYGIRDFRRISGRRLGQTMYETDHLPRGHVELCRQTDGVLVPGPWNEQVFKLSKVDVPIYVVPYGIYPEYVHVPEKKQSSSRFRFVSVFAWCGRKNPEALLRAYFSEFRKENPVELVIKSTAGAFSNVGKIAWSFLKENEHRRVIGDLPKFSVHEESWPRQRIWELYESSDCYVSAHYAEGIGLPMLEAQARGLPVIATDYSESRLFVNDLTGYPVKWERTEATDMRKYISGGQYENSMWWASVSVPDLQSAMRQAYESRDTGRLKGEAAARGVLEVHNPETTARAFVAAGF